MIVLFYQSTALYILEIPVLASSPIQTEADEMKKLLATGKVQNADQSGCVTRPAMLSGRLTGRVDRSGRLPGVGGDVAGVLSVSGRALNGGVGTEFSRNRSNQPAPLSFICGKTMYSHGQVVRGGLGGRFTRDELLPEFVGLVDDLNGVLLGLGLTREGEDVLGLAIGNLVDPEPLVCNSEIENVQRLFFRVMERELSTYWWP